MCGKYFGKTAPRHEVDTDTIIITFTGITIRILFDNCMLLRLERCRALETIRN